MYKAAGKFYQGIVNGGKHIPNDVRGWNSQSRAIQRKTFKKGDAPPLKILTEIRLQVVYLVRFIGHSEPFDTFIKVGVSCLGLTARFQNDLKNYDLELLATSSICGRDAYLLEQSIHSAFKRERITPRLPLSSGNTECYRDDGRLIGILMKIISL